MPLRKIPGLQAIQNYRSNANAVWPSRASPDTNRIEPLCKPAFSSSFKLKYGEKIFTIGSCFAREIEKALAARGFDVVTSRLNWPDKATDTNGTNVLNNYGVASIENELRWALDPDQPFDPKLHVVEIAPGRYCDLHIPLLRGAPREKISAYRTAITDVTRQVKDCRVVVMTLGLSELWFDVQSQTYINATPPRTVVARFPERFEVHLLSFQETLSKLQTIFKLLQTHCRPDQRILLTVSPVPLGATHTPDDVLVVNSYSKSVLRAAAEHIASAMRRVDYFPSFESVMLSERSRAWEDDQIHIRSDLIELNVGRMVDAYRPDSSDARPADLHSALLQAEEKVQIRDLHGAIGILEPLRDFAHLDPEFATTYVDLCVKLRRPEDAKLVIDRLPHGAGDWRTELLRALVMTSDDRSDGGLQALQKLAQTYPTRARIFQILVDAYMQRKQWNDALEAAFHWTRLNRMSAEPLRRTATIHRQRGDRDGAETAYRLAFERPEVSSITLLEYVEFLIEDKRFEEARRMFDIISPDSPTIHYRYNELRAFLPDISAPLVAAQ